MIELARRDKVLKRTVLPWLRLLNEAERAAATTCFYCSQCRECWPDEIIAEYEIHPMALMEVNCPKAEQGLPK